MTKVEIDFPGDFASGIPASIPLGRLLIGDSVCRLYFGTDGKVRMLCSPEARPFIVFADPITEPLGFTS